jgi:hypothetical protein
MIQLSTPKIFSFDTTSAHKLESVEAMRDYATENGLMYIEPTRLNKILIRVTFLNEQTHRPQYIRVFFFKNLATFQSSIIHFEGNIGSKDYSSDEGEFWNNEPFFIESIGFAPEPNGLGGNTQFKINIYKK